MKKVAASEMTRKTIDELMNQGFDASELMRTGMRLMIEQALESEVDDALEMLNTARGPGLSSETMVTRVAQKMYVNPGFGPHSGLALFGAEMVYGAQAPEAVVRVAEALGGELAKEIRAKPESHQWTAGEAEESFNRAVAAARLDHTLGHFVNLGYWLQKTEHEEAMHAAFLKTYRDGGKVCDVVPPTAAQLTCYNLQ